MLILNYQPYQTIIIHLYQIGNIIYFKKRTKKNTGNFLHLVKLSRQQNVGFDSIWRSTIISLLNYIP